MESIKRNQATLAKIQELEDGPVNPLTGKKWPRGHKQLKENIRRLPVYGSADAILSAYHGNNVFVLSSGTGSGKSTQVGKFLVFDEYESGCRIACTQPKRLPCRQLSARVAKEMGVTLGQEVGYQIGGDKLVDKKKKRSRLVFLTERSLTNQSLHDKDLSQYACVIIDEAHERTLETDILLPILKDILSRRSDFKVVIMSATLDAEFFQRYFFNCPLVEIPGQNFKVDTFNVSPGHNVSDYLVLATNVVAYIHKHLGQGDILVFLPGEGEIRKLRQLILKTIGENIEVGSLYATMGSKAQTAVVEASSTKRRCILATNVAETSITIPGIVFVIDAGFAKQLIYIPRLDMVVLKSMACSQAAAGQRKGRAGRVQDGVCFRLYTKEDFDLMPKTNRPDIRCNAIHGAVLQLLNFSDGIKVYDFDWIEVPDQESLERAAQDLENWGYLNEEGKLTRSGELAVRCPLDPIWYRAIEIAAKLGCVMDMVDIAVACDSQKEIFVRPPGLEKRADQAKARFANCASEHMAYGNAFNWYMALLVKSLEKDSKIDVERACELNFLNYQSLEEIRKTRDVLGTFLKEEADLVPTRAETPNHLTVMKALAIAFCTQAAIHKANDQYRTVNENVPALLDATSPLLEGRHEWVVYSRLWSSGSRAQLEKATAIRATWLVDLPYFQDDRLAKKGDGTYRQPQVKASLDAARAKLAAERM